MRWSGPRNQRLLRAIDIMRRKTYPRDSLAQLTLIRINVGQETKKSTYFLTVLWGIGTARLSRLCMVH